MSDELKKAKEEFLLQKQEVFKKNPKLLDAGTLKILSSEGYIPKAKDPQNEYLCTLEINKELAKRYENVAITKDLWQPKDIIYHAKDFVDWIDSITFGYFPNKIYYEKFEFYKLQAQKWFDENVVIENITDEEQRSDAILREYNRIDENSLYFANKYGYVKEGSTFEGTIRYVAKESNAVLFYLLDCNYTFLFGKPRQIFATTTMGLFTLKKMITQYNFYMKYITENDSKGKAILNDRIKFPFDELQDWMKPSANRDNLSMLELKGKSNYPNTKVETSAPTPTAINQDSPNVVLIDEIDQIKFLDDMIKEARPTMFAYNNITGELKQTRQIIAWGTGTAKKEYSASMKAFEKLWIRTITLWQKGNYRGAMFVPLFFSWHPRCTTKFYLEERDVYYTGINIEEGVSLDENKQLFHMHYPSTWTDMFAKGGDTLIPKEMIEEGISNIIALEAKWKPQQGYFEPIYDINKPETNEASDVPYKIIGANWVPVDDNETDMATAFMLFPPDRDYLDRYYQGTDPIGNETGLSFMCSVIWDKWIQVKDENNTEFTTQAPVCMVYHRQQQNPKATFLQCLLMGLYYDNNIVKRGVPHLVENNIGLTFKEYLDNKGFINSLVLNKQLPLDLQSSGANWGVNTQGRNGRKAMVVYKLRECLYAYYKNIYFKIIFKELETYFNKPTSTGTESWQPVDKKLYRDDGLDGLSFSYICARCFDNKQPRLKDSAMQTNKKKLWVTFRDANGMLDRRQEVVILNKK